VGINLLREGLDLPEVSLIAILDADKEGFLRSTTALIQVMGRAARHEKGHVIMYADRKTRSMNLAIKETKRRRKIQDSYNKKHGLKPKTIVKKIKDNRLAGAHKKDKIQDKLPLKDIASDKIDHLIDDIGAKMELAAKNLEFEQAAAYRDQISELRKLKK